jgi:hypothetical protein
VLVEARKAWELRLGHDQKRCYYNEQKRTRANGIKERSIFKNIMYYSQESIMSSREWNPWSKLV